MKTEEKENEQTMGMSIKKISIPSRLASEVLQGLEKRQIKCHYVGVSPSGRIIMRLYYKFTPDTELFLLTLEDEIKESEKLLDLLVCVGARIAEDTLKELILRTIRASKSSKIGAVFFR